MPAVHAVDRAEAGGDAHQALTLIEAGLDDTSKLAETFWHPERLLRLEQLVVFASVLPRWAISRWILAQAVRWMDASQQRRYTRAFDQTVRVAGGPERYAGVDEIDSHCKLMDHDWVYRQLLLYEHGGLLHFLDRVASRALLHRADRIREWARAPLGAYRLVAQTSRTLRWFDLSSGNELEIANIGSASLLDVGEHAIGRLVPTDDGQMFESAPLFVPPDVAGWVAETPSEWMSALQRGCHRKAPIGLRISTRAPGWPLLSDVPAAQQVALLESVREPGATGWTDDDLLDARLEVLRLATAERPQLGDQPFEPWPVVSAILLDPAILVGLFEHPRAPDASGYERLAARLASPADEVCRQLALELGAAA